MKKFLILFFLASGLDAATQVKMLVYPAPSRTVTPGTIYWQEVCTAVPTETPIPTLTPIPTNTLVPTATNIITPLATYYYPKNEAITNTSTSASTLYGPFGCASSMIADSLSLTNGITFLVDTNLYRNAENQLRTDDSFICDLLTCAGITATSTTDHILKLGDAAGAQKVYIKDSGNATVASIDSDGKATFTTETVNGSVDCGHVYPIADSGYNCGFSYRKWLAVNGVSGIFSGNMQAASFNVGATQIVDSSRNLLNIGTYSGSGQITSTLATGTAPLAVTSTTKCTNLNVDSVDDIHFVKGGPITMASGVVVITDAFITTSSQVMMMRTGGTVATIGDTIVAQGAGAATITSTNALDDSVFKYTLIN